MKLTIRKELFLAIYSNEQFTVNDLKAIPLQSFGEECLLGGNVDKIIQEMMTIGAVMPCGLNDEGDEEFTKGFMFNHADWEVVDYDNYTDELEHHIPNEGGLLESLRDKLTILSRSYSIHERAWKHFNRLCAQHSELRPCLGLYISKHDNLRLDLKAEILAIKNAITAYKEVMQVHEKN
ncbi:hypothetical protein [Vibrio owensii]|uniref:hypothetical protein n=1 Tax=Vibrio owensii TaxID=696485 RepID=UPI0005F0B650|nr:hypothetical protein [Vibrio owensii]